MKIGCPFITCAVKGKKIEFCWQCPDQDACERWRKHREWGCSYDSFVCYQRLEDNIALVKDQGVSKFIAHQREREQLLVTMLDEFNEGRSKSFYCIAATVMEVQEIAQAIARARAQSAGADLKSRAKAMHAIMEKVADQRNYSLKLRKKSRATGVPRDRSGSR